MKETWENVKGFESYYQVSNLGRVKGLKRKLFNGKGYHYKEEKLITPYPTKLKQRPNYNLYHIRLSKNNTSKVYGVHRLVALHFIPNPENKPQVNHIDFDTSNNAISNLEWCTNKENIQHSVANGRRDKETERKGTKCKVVNNISGEQKQFVSMNKASLYIGKSKAYISVNIISNIYRNKEYSWEMIKCITI